MDPESPGSIPGSSITARSAGYPVPVNSPRDGEGTGAAAGGGNHGTGSPLSRAAASVAGHTAKVHFAGINTRPLSAATLGRDILISYADVLRSAYWWTEMKAALEAGRYRSVILDSGAFTVRSDEGFTVDIDRYVAFCVEHQHLFDTVVGLDDIGGDLAATWGNQAMLEAAGIDALPVYHQDEPWAVLEAYLDRYDRIGVGFARKPGGALAHPRRENAEFLREFFRRVRAREGKWVHGFAMTDWANKGWPFNSVDSTTWIYEYRALRRQEPYEAEKARPTCIHAVSGDLANLLDWYEDAELMEITLDSYDPPALRGEADADDVAEFTAWIEEDGRGQARTVFRRYGAAGLWQKINEIDARKCAVAVELREAA